MKIKEMTKTYGTRLVLHIPKFEFQKGKIYAVIGANGSGKSTLAKIIAGVESPDDMGAMNEFFVNENSCEEKRDRKPLVAYMPQKSFPFRLSVRNNILLMSDKKAEAEQRAEELISALGLSELAQKAAHRLSGGETARMALARVMIEKSDLLILDEPTAALDIKHTFAAEKLICDYRDRDGASVLLVTHSLKQAARIADFVLFMHEGELVEWGMAEQVLTRPKSELTKEFLDFYSL